MPSLYDQQQPTHIEEVFIDRVRFTSIFYQAMIALK